MERDVRAIGGMTLEEYLQSGESILHNELAYGFLVREPSAPSFLHQYVVGRLFAGLDRHVRDVDAGVVIVSPVDVVLDRRRALVVQPDVVFVTKERMGICDQQIWGPPDLVVEVLSDYRRRHDRVTKVGWFRRYGVRECWLVDPISRQVEVIDLTRSKDEAPLVCEGAEPVRSAVLPRLDLPAEILFHKQPPSQAIV